MPEYPEENKAKCAAQLIAEWREEWMRVFSECYAPPTGSVLLPERNGMLACCVEMAVRNQWEVNCQSNEDFFWFSLFHELVNILDFS